MPLKLWTEYLKQKESRNKCEGKSQKPSDPLLLQVKGGETNYRYKSNLKVETRTLEEVKRVLEYVSGSKTRLTGIMLDHMNGDVDVTMLNDAVELINGGAETEIDTELALESRRRTKRA
ncbi:hypothetical protein YC2023_085018 [Brassica napus]